MLKCKPILTYSFGRFDLLQRDKSTDLRNQNHTVCTVCKPINKPRILTLLPNIAIIILNCSACTINAKNCCMFTTKTCRSKNAFLRPNKICM